MCPKGLLMTPCCEITATLQRCFISCESILQIRENSEDSIKSLKDLNYRGHCRSKGMFQEVFSSGWRLLIIYIYIYIYNIIYIYIDLATHCSSTKHTLFFASCWFYVDTGGGASGPVGALVVSGNSFYQSLLVAVTLNDLSNQETPSLSYDNTPARCL